MDTTNEVSPVLRRSPRIAEKRAAQVAAQQATEASSACEPSQSDSHIEPILKHDYFACNETICDNCRIVFDDCVKMVEKYNACVDAVMKLPGNKFREEMRMILQEGKERVRGLKSQESREG
ncbi:hypothetical protein N7463_006119 [Penicillium fimorum]|uniref:Uncharacterized protein n=1 Tax=Penicillium fimorum TaxID=1882269 RepID=A0A9W9XTR2_9EURO|nr:hypothetical protein N7463_006119 [Penicillium fimorum]